MAITGGCLCGGVRYRIDAEPIATRVCWCRVCQYLGAGNGTVNTGFASAAVHIEGTLDDYVSIAESGNVMHRRFCPQCGTQLFSAAEARPHLVFVRGGTLDNPEIGRPTANIWASSAPGWACLDPALTRVERQPPPIA